MKSKLEDITDEIESVKQVKAFYDELYNIQKERIRSGIEVMPTDMEYIIKDLRKATINFEAIDDSKDTDIALKDVKNTGAYTLYKIQVDSELYDDAGLDEALGELDSGFKAKLTMTVALTRNTLNDSIDDMITMPIPSKYK
ncbi:hypothetical protein NQ117_07040 [Paenibacillus sp. SC116]|uniref:hypothetical protein n=1 Tax=Paenibacillus sp. SC116 TaxID=2968986 RepID=UPI00215B2DC0|nr:hypothetical protein [Paenibacillus sp. SC116]MCR8843434.1 hypothetical protein [Paenibacillus sp. SC116]